MDTGRPMVAKITRPDPMRSVQVGEAKDVFISVLTYENREDIALLPKNVRIGLAVPKMLSEEEWLKRAKVFRAEQIEMERTLRLKWDIDD